MSIYRSMRIEVFKKLANNSWSNIPIVLRTASDMKVDEGIGKIRDQFSFKAFNPNNVLNRQKFYGDGSTTAFTLYHNVPPEILGDTNRFAVATGTSSPTFLLYNPGTPGSGEFKVTTSGTTSTLTLGSAPSNGTLITVYFTVIGDDDIVDIYKYDDTVAFSTFSYADKQDRLLISGTVQQSKIDTDNGASTLDVQGFSFIDIIFKGLVFHRTPANNQVHLVTIALIAQLNQFNPNRRIWGESLSEWQELGNPTTKADGSTFPTINYNRGYDRAIRFLEDLWTDRYTGDGDYLYQVRYNVLKDRYEFLVRPKTDEIIGSAFIENNSDIYDVQASRNVDGVINAVIFNVGPDANGISQEGYAFDPSKSAGIGASWIYYGELRYLLPAMFNSEYELNKADFDVSANNVRLSDYPSSAALAGTYDIQLFKQRDNYGKITGATISVTTQSAYNDAFVTEAIWIGREIVADRIIKRNGFARLSASFDVRENPNYTLGGKAYVQIPSFGVGLSLLRVNRRTHTFWDEDISLEEDVPKEERSS